MATTSNGRANEKHERRNKGEGSLYYHEGRKVWCATLDLGVDSSGKRIRKTVTAKEKQDVIRKMRAIITGNVPDSWADALNNSNDPRLPKQKHDVYEFTQMYLDEFKQGALRSSSFKWYCDIAKIIKGGLSGINIEDLEVIDLQRFFNNAAKKYAETTLKHMQVLLKQSFAFARTQKLMTEDPFSNGFILPKSKITKKKGKAIPAHVCQLVIRALDKSPVYKPIIMLMLYTGMRIGEVLALQWSDIDELNRIVHIERAISDDYSCDDDSGKKTHQYIIGETKTVASQRIVSIDDSVLQLLNEWRQYAHTKFGRGVVIAVGGDNLVFPNQYGKLRSYDGFRRQFDRFLDGNGLTEYEITFHRFRHTFATILMEEGVNPRTVQEMLGHKKVETTLGTYTTVSIGAKAKASKTIESAIKRIGSTATTGVSPQHKLIVAQTT